VAYEKGETYLHLTSKSKSEYLENKSASSSQAGKKEVEVKDNNNQMDCT
jgi:hypothetical protein